MLSSFSPLFSSISPLSPCEDSLSIHHEEPLLSQDPVQLSPTDTINGCAMPIFTRQTSDNSLMTRTHSGLKRSLEISQDDNPYIEQERSVFFCTSGFDELSNKLNNAKTFHDIIEIMRLWKDEIPCRIKNEVSIQFQNDLVNNLSSFTDELMALNEETRGFLPKIRQSKNSLEQLNRRFGNLTINHSRLDAILSPFITAIENKTHLLNQTRIGQLTKLAEKLIAEKKGQEIRDKTVTVDQVHSLIKDKLFGVDPKEVLDISRALARQILEIMENPDVYKAKSCEIKAHKKNYTFASNTKDRPQQLSLNFDCRLQISSDENHIELYIIPKGVRELVKGTFKIPSIAQCFTFELKAKPKINSLNTLNKQPISYKREGTYSPVVIQNVKSLSGLSAIERGIKMQARARAQDPFISIAALPKKLNPSTTSLNPENVSYTQKWYNFDLYNAVINSRIPIDISEKPKCKSLSYYDIFKVIQDVGDALNKSHKINIIHKDIKPLNIFMEVDEKGNNLKGFAADYDLAQNAGLQSPQTDFFIYWDTLCNLGITTPFTDVYSLALSLVQTIFKDFNIDGENILSKNHQNYHLLKVMRKILNCTDVVEDFSDEEMIKSIEDQVETMIQESDEDEKIIYQAAKAHIQAFKGSLKIFQKVLNVDRKISNLFLYSLGAIWKSIRDLSLINSSEKREAILLDEMGNFKNFNQEFSANIQNWNSLTNSHKIKEIKKYLKSALENTSLNEETKYKWSEYLKELKMREDVLTFLNQMNDLSPEDRLTHPLYKTLIKNPKLSQNEEEQTINEEIKKIKFMNPSLLEVTAKEKFQDFTTGNNYRNNFKIFLQILIEDKASIDRLRKEAVYLLAEITMIENTMAYASHIHKIFVEAVTEVPKYTMTMETFLSELKDVMANLNPEITLLA